jgi:hypothetical protein
VAEDLFKSKSKVTISKTFEPTSLVDLCYPFDRCNLLPAALLYDTSCNEKPSSVNTFIVNNPIIYIPLHVSNIWGHVQMVKSKNNFFLIL